MGNQYRNRYVLTITVIISRGAKIYNYLIRSQYKYISVIHHIHSSYHQIHTKTATSAALKTHVLGQKNVVIVTADSKTKNDYSKYYYDNINVLAVGLERNDALPKIQLWRRGDSKELWKSTRFSITAFSDIQQLTNSRSCGHSTQARDKNERKRIL